MKFDRGIFLLFVASMVEAFRIAPLSRILVSRSSISLNQQPRLLQSALFNSDDEDAPSDTYPENCIAPRVDGANCPVPADGVEAKPAFNFDEARRTFWVVFDNAFKVAIVILIVKRTMEFVNVSGIGSGTGISP